MTTLEIPLVTRTNLVGKVSIPESLSIVDQPQNGFGCFRILTPKDGDKRVVWNRSSLREIKDAKLMFNDLISQGMVPHKVDPNGRKTPEVMSEFDPLAEEIIFAPIGLATGG